MISFILPYTSKRYDLLMENFASLESQTNQDFEVIVICQNSYEDFKDSMPSFPLKVLWMTTTGQNPSQAQNLGVEHADGDIICLSSPEVINANTNVEEMLKLPENTFWVGRVVEEYLDALHDDYSYEYISNVDGMTDGIPARCTEMDWDAWKYFLCVIHKKDYVMVGGMDEEFMNGIAWEDRDFADRVKKEGMFIEFNEMIAGIHLWHPRSYQHDNKELRDKNRAYYYSKSMVEA